MGMVRRMPRILGTLIVVAIVVATISGVMLVQRANASELEGSFDNISADGSSLLVEGKTFLINSETKIEGVLAALTPGTVIEIKYAEQDDGSLVALEIEVEDDEDIDNDLDEAALDDNEELELEGFVGSYAPGASITVNSQLYLINGDTEIEGTPAADTTVEVEYIVQGDGSFLAVEIEVENDDLDDEDIDDDLDEADPDDEEELELEGFVKSYAPGASITVNGQLYLINGDTEIEGTPAEGAIVEVEYVVDSDNLVALEIEVEDDDEDVDDDLEEDTDDEEEDDDDDDMDDED